MNPQMLWGEGPGARAIAPTAVHMIHVLLGNNEGYEDWENLQV